VSPFYNAYNASFCCVCEVVDPFFPLYQGTFILLPRKPMKSWQQGYLSVLGRKKQILHVPCVVPWVYVEMPTG
jgi:hypothetical protein